MIFVLLFCERRYNYVMNSIINTNSSARRHRQKVIMAWFYYYIHIVDFLPPLMCEIAECPLKNNNISLHTSLAQMSHQENLENLNEKYSPIRNKFGTHWIKKIMTFSLSILELSIYEGRFNVRREVDLTKTANVNANIMYIFGKIELFI